MANESHNRYGFRLATAAEEAGNIMHMRAAASQTWVKGDMLDLTSGLVSLATSTSALLLGYAGDDRTSTSAGDRVPVIGIKPGTHFIAIADADPSGLEVGAEIDLVGSSGAQMVDVGASSTDVFTFLGLLPDQTSGAAYSEILVCITSNLHELFTT